MNKIVFQSIVDKLLQAKDKEGKSLNMDSIIISEGDDVYKYKFKEDNKLNDLRSISKPVIALALGIAMENGLYLKGEKVTLDTKIFPFFKDKIMITNSKNIKKLEKVTLKHVLTHTIGYADGLLFRKDIERRDKFTLLDYVFNHDIVHEPGEYFVYSNVGPYILSALIQEELGLNLSDWVKKILFDKIDITDFKWGNYGNYCKGATGLELSHEDMHKIGKILINKGYYNGQQLISRSWVEQMTNFQVKTNGVYDSKRVFPKKGYGFYIYICEERANSNYYIDGTDGQYLIVIPDKNLLITTFGHQPDMKPITECLRDII